MRPWLQRGLAATGWAATLGCVVLLWMRRETLPVFRAMAEPVSYVVAPETAGRIMRLDVALFDDIAPGTVIAALDDAAIRISIDETRRELARLEAEAQREAVLLAADRSDVATDRSIDLRRFARDVEQAHIDLLQAQADQEEDRILITGLQRHLERSSSLSAERVGPLAQMEDDQVARDAASRRLQDREVTLRALRNYHERAQQRLASASRESDDNGTDALLRPFRYAVEAQAARLERIQLEAARLELRAPRAGRVARILRRAGEMVASGEPIVELTEPQSRAIVAYVDPRIAPRLQAGQGVRITRQGEHGAGLASTITKIGPAVTLQPEQLWPIERTPAWGLPLVIALPAGATATPGDVFEVRLAAER